MTTTPSLTLPATVRAVLLDIDGTLIDSNDANTRVWHKAMTEAGLSADSAAIREHIGMGGDQLLPTVAGVEKSSEAGKKASELWETIYSRDELPHLRAFPGVRPLVEALQGHGFVIVVATSGEKELAEKALEIAGIADLVDDMASSADAEKSKPHPDIVLAALQKVGTHVAAGEVILIGDTPFDIEAAQRAGLLGAIALRCGGFTDAQLAGAMAIYDDPADLLAHLAGSPLRGSAAGA